MQSREASNSSKFSQHSTSVPVSNPFQTRPFGISTQTENRALDEADELSQQGGLNVSHVPVYAPGTPPEAPKAPSPLFLQTKLNIGKPGDQYEREADQVALQVVNRINSPPVEPIQRREISPTTELAPDSEANIQRKQSGLNLFHVPAFRPGTTPPSPMQTVQFKGGDIKPAPINVEDNINSKKGSGEGLADNIRQPMEQAFGADFSGVKVHADGESDQLNQSLNARAFATGKDIFFRQGAYNPNSRDGQELLAHELTHVVQQNGSAVQRKSVAADSEKESAITTADKTEQEKRSPEEDQSSTAAKTNQATQSEQKTESSTATTESAANKVEQQTQPVPASQEAATTTPPPTDLPVTNANPQENTTNLTEDSESAAKKLEQQTQPAAASQEAAITTPPPTDLPATNANPQENTTNLTENSEANAKDLTEPSVAGVETPKAEVETEKAEATQELAGTQAETESVTTNTQQLASAQTSFAPPQPKQMFAATEAGINALQPQEILGTTPDGLVLFQTDDPSSAQALIEDDSESGTIQAKKEPQEGSGAQKVAVHPIPESQAAQMRQKRQQQADSALSQFVASNSARLSGMAGMGKTVQPRIQASAVQAKASVEAGIKQNQATITNAIAQAQTQVQTQAKTAQGQIQGQYEATVKAIQDSTANARTQIETEYKTSLEKLTQLETDTVQKFDSPFADASKNFQKVGTDASEKALTIGKNRSNQYASEPLPKTDAVDDFFDGADYHKNRRQAKVDAANQVAQEYSKSFIDEGKKAADSIAENKAGLQTSVKSMIAETRKQLETKRAKALEELKPIEKQALTEAKNTLTQQLGQIDQSLKTTVASLNQFKTTQLAQLAQVGQQQQAAIDRNAAQAVTGLQGKLNVSTQKLHENFQALVEKAKTIQSPNIELLHQSLGEAQEQLDGMMGNVESDLETGIHTSTQGITATSQQTLQSLDSVAQQGTAQAANIVQTFATTTSEVVQSATQVFKQAQDEHTNKVNTKADECIAEFQTLTKDLEQSFNTIAQNLTTKLNESVDQLKNGLQGAVNEIEGKITTKADEAANKVQPAWKGFVKILVDIVVTIAVTAAIAALAASGVGLIGLVLAGAAIGAAGGLVKCVANNAIDGKKGGALLDGAGSYIIEGAITGALSGLGAGVMAKAANGTLALAKNPVLNNVMKEGINLAIDTTKDTVTDVAQKLRNGEPFSLEMVTKSFKDQAVMNTANLVGGKLFDKIAGGIGNKLAKNTGTNAIEAGTEAAKKPGLKDKALDFAKDTVKDASIDVGVKMGYEKKELSFEMVADSFKKAAASNTQKRIITAGVNKTTNALTELPKQLPTSKGQTDVITDPSRMLPAPKGQTDVITDPSRMLPAPKGQTDVITDPSRMLPAPKGQTDIITDPSRMLPAPKGQTDVITDPSRMLPAPKGQTDIITDPSRMLPAPKGQTDIITDPSRMLPAPKGQTDIITDPSRMLPAPKDQTDVITDPSRMLPAPKDQTDVITDPSRMLPAPKGQTDVITDPSRMLPAPKGQTDVITDPSRMLPAPKDATTDANLSEAKNRALHEEYKKELRQQMEAPHVENAELKDKIGELYRANAKIGSGSTADAIRHERATGQPVGGKFHTQKGEDTIKYLERWLDKNPHAAPGDRAAAENIILDIKDALGK